MGVNELFMLVDHIMDEDVLLDLVRVVDDSGYYLVESKIVIFLCFE